MKDRKLKVYLIAGEPSGDALGSRLMNALVKKTKGNVEFFGVGGESMEEAGLKSLFDVSDLAVMGLVEVIPSIPKILGLIKKTIENIKEVKPDIVVTIDSWSFCSRIHKKLKKEKLGIPQVHYVAPQVWAWNRKRAKTMYKYIDHLITLLPNEPEFFEKYGLESTFVGHPVIESGIYSGNAKEFRKKHDISKEKQIIAILPGSRKNEVDRLLPIFIETARRLLEKNPHFVFVIPTVKTVSDKVKNMVWDSRLPIIVVETPSDRHDAFIASDAAIAASGTVALELAIAGVPHLVGYKVSRLTYEIGIRLVKIRYMNLSNILLNREVIPEFLQFTCTPENLEKTILKLLDKDSDLYKNQMKGIEEVKKILGVGEQTPSEKASDVIVDIINKSSFE